VSLCSEEALVKLLYHAGFRNVYGFKALPDHEQFRETRRSHRRRTVLLASPSVLEVSGTFPIGEPSSRDPWVKAWYVHWARAQGFMRLPFPQKAQKVLRRIKRLTVSEA